MKNRIALSPFKLHAIKMADLNIELFARNRSNGLSDTDTLATIIRNPEKPVVVAVWGDSFEPDYCGMLVVKGGADLNLEKVNLAEVDAVHCSNIETAVAMRQVFGDEAKLSA